MVDRNLVLMASRCATEAQNWRTQAQWLHRESYRQFVPFGLLLPYPPTAPNPKEKNLSLLPYTPTLKPKLLEESPPFLFASSLLRLRRLSRCCCGQGRRRIRCLAERGDYTTKKSWRRRSKAQDVQLRAERGDKRRWESRLRGCQG